MTTISQIQFIAPPPPPPSYRSILSINPTAPIAAPKMKYLPTPLRIYWTSLDDVNTLNKWTDKPNLIKITCSCSTTICVSDFNLTNCKRKWYKRVVYGNGDLRGQGLPYCYRKKAGYGSQNRCYLPKMTRLRQGDDFSIHREIHGA